MRTFLAASPRSAEPLGLLLSTLFLILGLLSPSAGAQDEAPLDTENFFESIDVEIVNIDVYVTDPEGKPVSGLSKDDFVVLRDRHAIDITNFYAVADGRPAQPSVPSTAPAAPQDESLVELPELSLEQEALPEEHRLWLVIFVDNFNIDPIERNRILPGVRQFIGQTLKPGDRAMIVTYDRKLEVRQPFTDQKNLLYKALLEIEDDAGFVSIRNRNRYDALTRIEDVNRPDSSLINARTYAEEIRSNVDHTVDALERLLESLGGLPGRKAFLHASSGIPMLAGEELFNVVGVKWNMPEAYAEIGRHDTTRDWERVNRKANAHRVVFYTLDAGGLRGMEFGAAEYASFVNPKIRTTLDSVVPQNLQASLRLMALETGGRAILNRNEVLPALVEVAQDFRSFYSLGISSSDADAGRYHKIEVKLKKPQKGFQIRHRAGYRSKDIGTRMRESLRSALLYSHERNPLGINVRWGTPQRHEGKHYMVPVQLQIPLKDLVILPLGDKHELRLRYFVGAAGSDGDLSEVDSAPIGLRLAGEHVENARKESLLHTHKLILNPGQNKIGVSVLDTFSRQSSTVTAVINVGPG